MESEDETMSSDEYYNDSDYEPVIPNSQIRKIYEVDYQVYSPLDILKAQTVDITYISEIINQPAEISATLLRYFGWNREKLVDSYMINPEKTLLDGGVNLKQIPVITQQEGFVCDICCNDDSEQLALSCGHAFCLDCYRSYLDAKIVQQGESRKIKCAAQDCTITMDEAVVKLIVEPKVYER
jgi:ariadne-1